MEKVAASPRTGLGSRRKAAARRVALPLLCCLAGGAWAQDSDPAPQDAVLAQARAEQPNVRVELNTSTLPRLEAQDSGFQAPRVDLAVAPQASGLGVVLGMSGFANRAGLQPNFAAPGTSMDLGLRWRQVVLSKRVDLTAWRRLNNDADAYTLIQQRQPVYGARVELRLADAPRSRFTSGNGFLGFQMESGARITVKRKDGRPMIYYRQAF